MRIQYFPLTKETEPRSEIYVNSNGLGRDLASVLMAQLIHLCHLVNTIILGFDHYTILNCSCSLSHIVPLTLFLLHGKHHGLKAGNKKTPMVKFQKSTKVTNFIITLSISLMRIFARSLNCILIKILTQHLKLSKLNL